MKPDAKTRWRCRRGMREMDLIFERFLSAGYETLDERERHTFDVLLDIPDQEIYDWLKGASRPEDPVLAALVGCVRDKTLAPDDAGE